MSPTAIAAVVLLAGWTAFALLTRNGRHAAYVILVAVHRLLVPATGERALNQPAGVRDALRLIILSAAWHMPRYWTWRARLIPALYGCLPQPEDLPAEVRHPDAEEAPAPDHPGRALPGGNPYPTAPQPVLGMEPISPARPFVLAEEYLP